MHDRRDFAWRMRRGFQHFPPVRGAVRRVPQTVRTCTAASLTPAALQRQFRTRLSRLQTMSKPRGASDAPDYYELLELPRNATQEQIKKAFGCMQLLR